MTISSVGSAHAAPIGPERAEGPGPDNDGDADDIGAATPVQAAPAPGTGQLVDKTA